MVASEAAGCTSMRIWCCRRQSLIEPIRRNRAVLCQARLLRLTCSASSNMRGRVHKQGCQVHAASSSAARTPTSRRLCLLQTQPQTFRTRMATPPGMTSRLRRQMTKQLADLSLRACIAYTAQSMVHCILTPGPCMTCGST